MQRCHNVTWICWKLPSQGHGESETCRAGELDVAPGDLPSWSSCTSPVPSASPPASRSDTQCSLHLFPVPADVHTHEEVSHHTYLHRHLPRSFWASKDGCREASDLGLLGQRAHLALHVRKVMAKFQDIRMMHDLIVCDLAGTAPLFPLF